MGPSFFSRNSPPSNDFAFYQRVKGFLIGNPQGINFSYLDFVAQKLLKASLIFTFFLEKKNTWFSRFFGSTTDLLHSTFGSKTAFKILVRFLLCEARLKSARSPLSDERTANDAAIGRWVKSGGHQFFFGKPYKLDVFILFRKGQFFFGLWWDPLELHFDVHWLNIVKGNDGLRE